MAEVTAISKIDTVIFDIGNVISRWDIRFLYEKIIEDPDELNWFLSNVVTPQWHFQHDAGRPFAETSAELIVQFPDQAERIKLFAPRFNETNPGEVEGIADIIVRIASTDVRLFALSNFSAEFWPPFRQDKRVFDMFEDVLISGEEKLTKPDLAIYHLALERFDVTAAQCLFVDDRAENIAAGKMLGIKGHVFVDAPRLEAELQKLELL